MRATISGAFSSPILTASSSHSSRPTSSCGVANGRIPGGGGRGSRGGIDGGVCITAGGGAAGGSVVAGGGVCARTAGGSIPRVRTSAMDSANCSRIMPDLLTQREEQRCPLKTSDGASYSEGERPDPLQAH